MESFEYKVTIIIPVYNVENYLRDCLNSLVGQTISQIDMEVLMINDGSPDHSLEICQEYVDKYDNFKVISQENQGVSAARNMGIRNARGKYLLYLDGDDMLSPETVKNVTDFFDLHYDEVDVVTYPLSYLHKNGSKTKHYRSKFLNQTGLYDVRTCRYIHLTTINIIVKNSVPDSPKLFREGIIFHEDEVYITELVMEKQVFGYVHEAEYIYLQHEMSSIATKMNPYYIFEQSMCAYEHLFQNYRNEEGNVALYVQEVVLNDLNWKLKSDVLYPYHYDAENFRIAQNRVVGLIDNIQIELLLNHPAIDDSHKYYFLSLKNNTKLTVRTIRNYMLRKNQLIITNDQGILRSSTEILIVLNQCKIKNDTLYFLGYLKHYAFNFIEKPILYVVIDEKLYSEVPLFLSQHSCYWTNIKTNTYWGFHFEISLCSVKEIKFVVKINNFEYTTNYYFTNKQPIQPDLKRNYLEGEHRAILYEKKVFKVVDISDQQIQQSKKFFEQNLMRNRTKQWLVRQYARKRTNKKIWLYRDSYNSKDNAFYQFKHDFEKNDGIERYYILNKEIVEWENCFTESEKNFLVEFGSKKHKKLFIQADKIFVSFIDRTVIVPFDANTIRYYWDLFHFELIYLQHGVMHAKIPNMYSKEKIYMIDKIVVSTQFEKDNVMRLGFRAQDIICSGMPRLDYLRKSSTKRKVLFALSWRKYLVGTDSNGHWCAKNDFQKSDYFCEVKRFLENKSLKNILNKYDYELEIKLHPNFQMYEDIFRKLINEKIKLTNNGTDLGEYAFCITDFSSFMYDFFYLDTPVILHIFDEERFRAGLHSYRDFFWPLETEYPYFAREDEDIVNLLELFMKNEGEIMDKFKNYVDEFYFSRKSEHSEKLYEEFMEIQ